MNETDILSSLSPSLQKAIRAFGLTDYEARAYVALIEFGEITANQVSERSGVPYTRVYDVLKDLSEKEFVEVRRGRPSTYRPRPPSEATALFIEKENQTLQENQKEIVLGLKSLYEKSGAQERHDVVIVRGAQAVLDKVQETLENTKQEVFFLSPVIAGEYIQHILPTLSKLGMQNVKTRILLTVTEATKGPAIPEIVQRIAEIRIAENLPGAGLIVDRRILFFITRGKEDQKYEYLHFPLDAQVVGLWIDHMDLVAIAAEWIDKLWNSLDSPPK